MVKKLTFFLYTVNAVMNGPVFRTRRQLAVIRYADRKANTKLCCLPAAVQNVFMSQRKLRFFLKHSMKDCGLCQCYRVEYGKPQ